MSTRKVRNLRIFGKSAVMTFKERLEQLETERNDLEKKIAKEDMKKPLLAKDRIIFWLQSFRSGDISNVEYQEKIIDTLVNSVYVYDTGENSRKIVIVFNISGGHTATIQCSDIDGLAPPKHGNSNTMFFVKHCVGFVIDVEKV